MTLLPTRADQSRRVRAISRLLTGLSIALALSTGHTLANDDYPSKPVRIIVPFAAGGPSDTAGRIAAQSLTDKLGQSVYVENKAGGGGIVGTEAVLGAPADGYTLILSDAATFIVVPISRKVSYDIERDFEGLGQIASAPQVLAVNPKSKFKTVQELVEFARANPGKLSFGSAGIGTTTHLSIQLLQQSASISLTHIPYRGTSLSIADVMNGNIDAVFGDVTTIAPFVAGGSVKALATTGDVRSPLLPDTPTMIEAGFPGVRMVNWFGLHVSSKTPPAILKRLKSAVRAVQLDPDFVARLAQIKASPGVIGADAFNDMVRDGRERFGPIIKALGPVN